MCNACALAWACLDVPPDERRARIAAAVHSDSDAARLQQALSLVRIRLWRDQGIDHADIARRIALVSAVAEGSASEAEVRLKNRIDAAVATGQVTAELFPAGVPDLRDPDTEALEKAVPALQAAIQGAGAAMATRESVDALADAIPAFKDIAKGFSARGLVDHAWWLGLAWWTFGRGALKLRRQPEARDAMERSASYYDQAGESKYAAECRQEAIDIATRFAADFDSAVLEDVRNMLGPQEPLERVQSLTRLSRRIGGAGDRYEAGDLAEDAAHILRDIGYPDPEHAFDAAVDLWVTNAAKSCTGNGLVARVCDVAGYWAEVLAARTNKRRERDPAASARADRALRGITPLIDEMRKQGDLARRELARRLEVWMPNVQAVISVPDIVDPSMPAVGALNTLDDELYGLRIACNEGASEAQVATALALRARAHALGSSVHVAKAAIEHAYVLSALRRFAEVPPLCDLARDTLLAGQPASLAAFPGGYERELYLTAIEYKARALSARNEHRAVLALCEPVIRDIEDERTRVSSPYQQSAFLATRAGLYELAAAAAYRTGDTDTLIAVTELLKARGALRSRLAPATNASTEEIDAQFREVNRALAGAAAGSTDAAELRERRGWLATARAIARARANHGTLPQISLAAVQAVLDADQCAISWFWIGSDTIVVVAISSESSHRAHVVLDAVQRTQLDDYLACLTALCGIEPDHKALVPRIDELVLALGCLLIPADVRAFIGGKQRLVLSPHRTLHLFPFHAAHGADGYLIEHFAIRYVPNLTSLLMPWQGTAEGPVLAVGIARFDDGSVLPNAEAEANAVAAMHGTNGTSLIDPTRAQFTSLPLQQYRCLHLATHGSSVLAGDAFDDPMQSCLYLRDGPLTALDIAALPLRSELVVLAACSSGQRSVAGRGLTKVPGDDIFGLQAVLFDAGVNAVLGALWPVADQVALPILVDFHRAYAGGELADAALQAAVIAHLRDPQRPQAVFFWAPFFVSALGMASRKAPVSPYLLQSSV